MKLLFIAIAAAVSGLAIFVANDPGCPAFQRVDGGGHLMRMWITGEGSPAVVFESGGSGANGAPLEMWERVQPAVAGFARTVSYDRAGSGRSAPGPLPRDARQVARELHTALAHAGVPPPYILVGHSFGGPLIRVFADLYPGEIAGLVLVDPTQEEFIAWQGKRAAQRGEKNYDDWKDGREWEDIQSSLAQAQASRVPEGVPVVLITGMGPRVLPSFLTEKEKLEYKTNHQMWLKFHTEWVERQLHARHLITENSGHGVPFEEPELVINAIRRMVEQVKEHRGAAAQ